MLSINMKAFQLKAKRMLANIWGRGVPMWYLPCDLWLTNGTIGSRDIGTSPPLTIFWIGKIGIFEHIILSQTTYAGGNKRQLENQVFRLWFVYTWKNNWHKTLQISKFSMLQPN